MDTVKFYGFTQLIALHTSEFLSPIFKATIPLSGKDIILNYLQLRYYLLELQIKALFLEDDATRDAFTHGSTGPRPRGPLKFLDLGGPEQNFDKPVNFKSTYKLTLRPCP